MIVISKQNVPFDNANDHRANKHIHTQTTGTNSALGDDNGNNTIKKMAKVICRKEEEESENNDNREQKRVRGRKRAQSW